MSGGASGSVMGSGGAGPQVLEPLPQVLGHINLKLPRFKGTISEDVDDHIRRFLNVCLTKGLAREDAYAILFPSTLDEGADCWYSQYPTN